MSPRLRRFPSPDSLGLLGALIVGACGGSGPRAPQTATDPTLPSGPAASAPAGAGAEEPAASAELAAGIKAFDAGAYADARRSFEAATRKDPKNYEAFHDLGLACEKLGDRAAAEGAYRAALAQKPDLDAAAVALSALLLDDARTDDAVAVARAGVDKRPASAPLHENLALGLAARGDQAGAAREFEEALKLKPSDPMYHLTYAHWLNAWKTRGAASQLDAARDLAKDDYGLLASIGLEYRMAGAFDACVKTFDHAIQIKDGGEVRTERALCRLGLKDEKGALEDLQAAVKKEPDYPAAHYYLGGRLAATRRFKEAAAEYARYLELAPSGSLAKAASDRRKAAEDEAKGTGAGPRKK
ncbi:MAG: tetratricopeptide repeat protein [Myxococcales bacterium]|nr:tetratricopeptide repeat protein [Myxococcales bacterium]